MKIKKRLFLALFLALYPIFFSFSVSAVVSKSVPYLVRVVGRVQKAVFHRALVSHSSAVALDPAYYPSRFSLNVTSSPLSMRMSAMELFEENKLISAIVGEMRGAEEIPKKLFEPDLELGGFRLQNFPSSVPLILQIVPEIKEGEGALLETRDGIFLRLAPGLSLNERDIYRWVTGLTGHSFSAARSAVSDADPTLQNTGDTLKQGLELAELSQGQLAESMGVSELLIYNYVTGRGGVTIPLDRAEEMAHIINERITELKPDVEWRISVEDLYTPLTEEKLQTPGGILRSRMELVELYERRLAQLVGISEITVGFYVSNSLSISPERERAFADIINARVELFDLDARWIIHENDLTRSWQQYFTIISSRTPNDSSGN